MTLAPLLNASPAIQLHAVAAMAAFGLGLVQFAEPKGTIPHRTVGWIWVVLMTIVGVSAFFIHEIRLWGPWSPIHLLAIYTLAMLPFAVLHARRHRVPNHRWGDDHALRRRAGDRRCVHLHARPHHACDGIGKLARQPCADARSKRCRQGLPQKLHNAWYVPREVTSKPLN